MPRLRTRRAAARTAVNHRIAPSLRLSIRNPCRFRYYNDGNDTDLFDLGTLMLIFRAAGRRDQLKLSGIGLRSQIPAMINCGPPRPPPTGKYVYLTSLGEDVIFIFTRRLPILQIIVQHFSANLKRVFREIVVSSRDSFPYCLYRSINIIHYRFSTDCIYSSFQVFSFFFCPESLVHNDINSFLCKMKCKIS